MKKFILMILGIITIISNPISALTNEEIKETYENSYYSPLSHSHTIEFEDIEYLMYLYNDNFKTVNSQASGQLLYNAQNLYISILQLEDTLNSTQQSYITQTSSQSITKLRYELGMITELKYLEEVVNTKTASQSTTSLENSIQTAKDSLNLLLGYSAGDVLSLKPLPTLSVDDLAYIGSTKDLRLAVDNNFTYESMPNNVIKENVTNKFNSLFDSIQENKKTLEINSLGMSNTQKNADIYDLQFQLGMISRYQYQQLKSSINASTTKYTNIQYDIYTNKIKYDLLVRGVAL